VSAHGQQPLAFYAVADAAYVGRLHGVCPDLHLAAENPHVVRRRDVEKRARRLHYAPPLLGLLAVYDQLIPVDARREDQFGARQAAAPFKRKRAG
jgi:hypothetical protein